MVISSPLSFVLAAFVGVAVACAGSLALAGRFEQRSVDALVARVDAVRAPPGGKAAVDTVTVLASATPLFPPISGPGAPAEVSVQLQGLARSPRRTAALLAISGGPATWMVVGEARGGIVLQTVSADSVTIGTPRGERVVALGAGGDVSAAAPSTSIVAPLDAPPTGFRSPPEPASAPGMSR